MCPPPANIRKSTKIATSAIMKVYEKSMPTRKWSLGEVEHTWAKPKYDHKSVRLRSPDFAPGGVFSKTDTRNLIFGVPGPLGAKLWDFRVRGFQGRGVGSPCMLLRVDLRRWGVGKALEHCPAWVSGRPLEGAGRRGRRLNTALRV